MQESSGTETTLIQVTGRVGIQTQYFEAISREVDTNRRTSETDQAGDYARYETPKKIFFTHEELVDHLNRRVGDLELEIEEKVRWHMNEGVSVQATAAFTVGSIEWVVVLTVMNSAAAIAGTLSLAEYIDKFVETVVGTRILRYIRRFARIPSKATVTTASAVIGGSTSLPLSDIGWGHKVKTWFWCTSQSLYERFGIQSAVLSAAQLALALVSFYTTFKGFGLVLGVTWASFLQRLGFKRLL